MFGHTDGLEVVEDVEESHDKDVEEVKDDILKNAREHRRQGGNEVVEEVDDQKTRRQLGCR